MTDLHSTGCKLTFSLYMPRWYTGASLRADLSVNRDSGIYGLHRKTHGNKVRRPSLIPSPARSMGVSPILGLTTEPLKGPIGDRYGAIRESVNMQGIKCPYALERCLFEITTGLVSEHDAEIMDAL